ncbi:MAG TPA: hypothetical protein VK004_03040 [Ignavibacteria bacterium]|nr:hypothetical protein [Ignavibacteria bacterium]
MSIFVIVASFGFSILVLALFGLLPLIMFEKDSQGDYPNAKTED